MSTPPDPPLANGFIVSDPDGGALGPTVCLPCLRRPEENPYALPWLFSGEHFTCDRCKGAFRQPED